MCINNQDNIVIRMRSMTLYIDVESLRIRLGFGECVGNHLRDVKCFFVGIGFFIGLDFMEATLFSCRL